VQDNLSVSLKKGRNKEIRKKNYKQMDKYNLKKGSGNKNMKKGKERGKLRNSERNRKNERNSSQIVIIIIYYFPWNY
jgi:hypothetical protein